MRRTFLHVRDQAPAKKGFHFPRCPSFFHPPRANLPFSLPSTFLPRPFYLRRASFFPFFPAIQRYEESRSSFRVTRFIGWDPVLSRCNRSNYGIKYRAVFPFFLPSLLSNVPVKNPRRQAAKFFSKNVCSRRAKRRNQVFRGRS